MSIFKTSEFVRVAFICDVTNYRFFKEIKYASDIRFQYATKFEFLINATYSESSEIRTGSPIGSKNQEMFLWLDDNVSNDSYQLYCYYMVDKCTYLPIIAFKQIEDFVTFKLRFGL